MTQRLFGLNRMNEAKSLAPRRRHPILPVNWEDGGTLGTSVFRLNATYHRRENHAKFTYKGTLNKGRQA